MAVLVKRVYEPASKKDGYRILVDRLWPRGMKKEEAPIDQWLKEVAPSTALRKWYDHDPEKWEAFCKKYYAELMKSAAVDTLLAYIHQHKTVTLLFASREEQYNHALALQKFISKHADL